MLKNRFNSFRYAFAGITDLLRTQVNARIHLFCFFVVVAAGFYFDIERWEWCAILGASALVFSLEAVNTALEYLTDLASPDIHPLAGKAKDAAAGAVLIGAIFSVIIGIIIFWERFFIFL